MIHFDKRKNKKITQRHTCTMKQKKEKIKTV